MIIEGKGENSVQWSDVIQQIFTRVSYDIDLDCVVSGTILYSEVRRPGGGPVAEVPLEVPIENVFGDREHALQQFAEFASSRLPIEGGSARIAFENVMMSLAEQL